MSQNCFLLLSINANPLAAATVTLKIFFFGGFAFASFASSLETVNEMSKSPFERQPALRRPSPLST